MAILIDLKFPCLICGGDVANPAAADDTNRVTVQNSNFVDLRAKFGIKNDSIMLSDDTIFQIFLKLFKVDDIGGSNEADCDVGNEDQPIRFCSTCKIQLGNLLELQLKLDILIQQINSGLEHIKGKMEGVEWSLQSDEDNQSYPRHMRIRRKIIGKANSRAKDGAISMEQNTLIPNQPNLAVNPELEQELDSSSIHDCQDLNNSADESEDVEFPEPEQQMETALKITEQPERAFRKFVEDPEKKLLIYGDKFNVSHPAFTFQLLENSEENDGQLQCTHCDLILPYNKEYIRRHVAKDHTNRFVCPHCPSRFSRGYSLRAHVQSVHEGQRIKKFIDCKICGKPIDSGKRKEHEWTHKSKEEKQEALKDRSGEVPWNRKQHGKKIQCDKCDYRCSSLPYLREHEERVHKDPDERRELCPECGKTFLNLRIHLRNKHPKEEEGVVNLMKTCLEPGCGKRFGNLGELTRHKNQVHRKLKPFKCTHCGKVFGNKWNLREHVKVTHKK